MDYSDPGFLLTLLVAAAIILYAFARQKIDSSAVFASGVVGVAVMFFLLEYWTVIYVVLAFFALGNVITKYRHKVKEEYRVAEGVRSYRNVFGNGGAAIVFSLLYFFTQSPVFLLGVVGAMATATADTFATEVGQVHEKNPRLITTMQRVEVGCSGAVSKHGLLAALGGAVTISSIPVLLGYPPSILFIGAAAGFIGCLIDSLIGATIERGLLDTHINNFLSTTAGGFVAILLGNYFLIFI